MASTHKHIRSSTANKRPTTAIADGQIALNTNASSPGLFFKDSTGASIIKIGPVHVGSTAPNATPGAGGSSGNSTGEIWLDNSLTPVGVKIWNGSAWVNATPVGSTTVQGLLELATSAETQTGTDTDRAVTPAGLQSKLSDSTSTTSSTTIASSTAVKSAYDLANAALPKSGGTITGNLEIGTTGSLSFEGSTADAFETTIAVTDPTADRTITLPDTTGTVVTTGDTGTVTSTMILDGTIVDADINASAAIAHSKLANITAASVLLGNASNVPTATALTGDVTVTSSGVTSISSGVIVNADVNASAAIAGTKISPDFGSQTITTTGVVSAALGAAATPSITFTGDLNTGVYSPGADQVAISTNGQGRLFVDASGNVGVGNSAQSDVGYGGFTVNGANGSIITLRAGGFNSGRIYTTGTDNINIDANGTASTNILFRTGTGSTERMRITSAGLVGVGTSSPGCTLDISSSQSGTNGTLFRAFRVDGNFAVNPTSNGAWTAAAIEAKNYAVSGAGFLYNKRGIVIEEQTGGTYNVNLLLGTQGTYNDPGDSYSIYSASTRKSYFAGNVGIGTTSPSALGKTLNIYGGTSEGSSIALEANNGAEFCTIFSGATAADPTSLFSKSGFKFAIATAKDATGFSEKMRLDSSGRLLVGTSTAAQTGGTTSAVQIFRNNLSELLNLHLGFNGALAGARINLSRSRNTTHGSYTILQNGDEIGGISFIGDDGVDYDSLAARIYAEVDGTPGANDMPGRLVFSTTADGASSPTERMRITQGGNILLANTTGSAANTGFIVSSDGAAFITRSGDRPFYVNRLANDGTLVEFAQDNATEGTISVSGTTVSYNGAHLSRWSQLPSGQERTEILRGSVLSNLDEMCEWGDEDNEQLNRMKVSDVEGDKNVSGVFQCWDDDDDTYTNDFYCAMTGDFIIRIAEGVTVERGDLLMSAGDGTAKPQDDDIIRSKTIAKVTSTNVSCTYEDGSYCVPCVLMAC